MQKYLSCSALVVATVLLLSGKAPAQLPNHPFFPSIHSPSRMVEKERAIANDPSDTLWTDLRWRPGFGRPGTDGDVLAIAENGSDLYIGGYFIRVEGRRVNGIARWDGTRWHTLGSGPNAGVNGVVYSIVADGDDIYVGGQFRSVGGIEARNVARYDRRTDTWHPLDQGIGGIPQSAVLSMVMFQGELVVGGRFVVAGTTVAVNVARWNGTRWRRVGRGANDMVRTLATDGPTLFAGGDFTIAGSEEVGKAAAFDPQTGEWSGLRTGLQHPYHSVAALAVDEGRLCIGGRFDSVAGQRMLNLAWLDRTTGEWHCPGGVEKRKFKGGLQLLSPDNFGTIRVKALLLRGDHLYIGGDIDTITPGSLAQRLVRYSFSADTMSVFPRVSAHTGYPWTMSGVTGARCLLDDSKVMALAPGTGDRIYIGGAFEFAGPAWCTFPPLVGIEPETVFAGNICTLSENDTVWRSIGGGGPDGTINAMLRDDDDIYITGDFLHTGPSLSVNGIARYDMATGTWHALGSGLSTPIEPFHYPPGKLDLRGNTITWFGGQLIVAGNFSEAGGVRTGSIAAWDPASDSWSALGNPGFGVVTDIASDSNRLYVIYHDSASAPDRRYHLAVWDGSSWERLPAVIDQTARTIALLDSSLYIGGDFRRVGSTVSPYLVRWNMRTGAWGPLGTNPDAPVHGLEAIDSLLYIGGSFTSVDGQSSRCAIAWNPSNEEWTRLGGFFNTGDKAVVHTFHKGRYGIYIGGDFTAYGFGHASNYSRAVVLWDGNRFRTLGTGLGNAGGPAIVNAMVSTDSILMIGGDFLYAGPYGISRIATWEFPDSLYVPGTEDGGDDPSGISADPQARTATTAAEPQTDPENEYWDDRFSPENHLPGTDDEVFALAPDDDGGLYAAGAFRRVVGLEVGAVAYWNGFDWEALDDGSGNGVNGVVFGMKVVGDRLYVGGQFTRAGGVDARNIAVWNRSDRTWSAIGEGIEGRSANVPFVSDIEYLDGTLYVAGNFTHAGGVAASNVAAFDQQGWRALGSGVEGVVTTLEFYGDDLFVGGSFGVAGGLETENIALWDGGGWSVPQAGIPQAINRLRMTPEGMYVAMNANDHVRLISPNPSVPFGYQIGAGFDWSHPGIASEGGEIRDIAVDGPVIYLGGRVEFTPPPTYEIVNHFPRINNVGFAYRDPRMSVGTLWHDMQGGVNGSVNAMVRSGEKLYVAGLFSNPGEISASNIAVWDNLFRTWRPLLGAYQLGPVSALVLHKGEVIAGGPFRYRENPLQLYDDDNYLARLNATGWDLVEGRVQGRIIAATSIDDEIIAAGQFITAAHNITVNVARWDSELEEWTALTPGSGVADQENFCWVSTLAADQQNIYVGGLFSVVDTFETPHVARFDRRSGTWHPLGDGLDGEVMALGIAPEGSLYAGGRFRHSGTNPVRGIARWDGEAWQPLGEGVEGDVSAIAFGDGKVFVAGLFDRSGGVDAVNVAAWNVAAQQWEPLGAGLTSSLLPSVEALVWQDGTLFAAGFFALSGGDSIRNVARFRNGKWERLGSGLNFAAFDMIGDRGDLYIAGSFNQAGGKVSPFVALWHDPTLSVEPAHSTFAGSLLGIPNPTAGAMIIRYTLPSPTDGRILITDATGRDVAELTNGRMQAGEHTLHWSAAGLPSGIYLCRLITAEGTTIEKIILQN